MVSLSVSNDESISTTSEPDIAGYIALWKVLHVKGQPEKNSCFASTRESAFRRCFKATFVYPTLTTPSQDRKKKLKEKLKNRRGYQALELHFSRLKQMATSLICRVFFLTQMHNPLPPANSRRLQ